MVIHERPSKTPLSPTHQVLLSICACVCRPAGFLRAENSQFSISSRKLRHQASGRSNISSFAGSSIGTARGKLRHACSTLSTGSGLTQRSEATYTSAGSKNSRAMSHWGRTTPRR